MKHEKNTIHYVDSFRSKYFSAKLTNELGKLGRYIDTITVPVQSKKKLILSVGQSLVIKLDQLFLPTIVHAIDFARTQKTLKGNNATVRYSSFFITQDGQWTNHAAEIKNQYPFLFFLRDEFIESTIRNVTMALKRCQRLAKNFI